jgi:hypothetical protein
VLPAANWTTPFAFDAPSACIVLSQRHAHFAVFLYSDAQSVTVEADARLVASVRALDAGVHAATVRRVAAAHAGAARAPWGVLYVSVSDTVLQDTAAPSFVGAPVQLRYAPAGQLVSLLFAFDNGAGLHGRAGSEPFTSVQLQEQLEEAEAQWRSAPAGSSSDEHAPAGAAGGAVPEAHPAAVRDHAAADAAAAAVLPRRSASALRFEYALVGVGIVVLVIVVALRNAVLAPAAPAAALAGVPVGQDGALLSPRQGPWRPGMPQRRMPGQGAPPLQEPGAMMAGPGAPQ